MFGLPIATIVLKKLEGHIDFYNRTQLGVPCQKAVRTVKVKVLKFQNCIIYHQDFSHMNRGIKHDFPFINIRKVRREV